METVKVPAKKSKIRYRHPKSNKLIEIPLFYSPDRLFLFSPLYRQLYRQLDIFKCQRINIIILKTTTKLRKEGTTNETTTNESE